MKKGALVLTAAIVLSSFVSNASTDDAYYKKISDVVKNNWEDNYIQDIKFNIGDNIMLVNGEEKKIDVDDNVVPIIKEGRTMLPARTIIEELDADIKFNEATREVLVKVEDIGMTLTIGKNEMEVQGEKKELDVAPVIENGRTLLPVRAITESIGMDVDWDESAQEITLKNDLQLKRIIVKTNGKMSFDKYNPIAVIESEDNEYVLQFESIGDTKKAYEELGKKPDVILIELDKIVSVESVDIDNIEYKSWGAERMHVNEYVQYLNE